MRSAGERLLLLTVKGGVKVLTFQRRDLGMGMSVDAFISELRQAVGEEAKPRVVLNLENVAYISSGPMGALIGLCKRVRAAGGEICFCALSPYVFDAFRVTKLHQVFEFHPSEEEAIQALGK
ncbi:MAG: STAS domain-containing protein [Planctomycetes bacterium]|nr:STAS domain-containing protein [Planctomycetota bacterium]